MENEDYAGKTEESTEETEVAGAVAPAEVVAVPAESVAVPAEMVAVPAEVIEAPAESVAVPAEVVAVPAEVVAVPAEVVAVPTDVQAFSNFDGDEDEVGSEEGGQCEQKRSLDRFSFVTAVRVRPQGSSSSQYEVCGDAGLPFLHARVRTPGGSCCGGGGSDSGSFTVEVADFSSRQGVMRVICDKHGNVTFESPPREVIGYATAERVLCSLRFTMRDAHWTARLMVKGPRYCLSGCQEHKYQILLPDESVEVASISRICANSPAYTMQVPEAMSTDMKAMLIGAILLFDRKIFT